MTTKLTLDNYINKFKVKKIPIKFLGLVNSKIKKNFLTYIDNEKFINQCNKNKYAKFVLVSKKNQNKISKSKKTIITENPKYIFFKILDNLNSKNIVTAKNKIHNTAKIHKTCIINGNQIVIGKNVLIESNVVINEKSKIMDNSIIRSGSIIGGDQLELKQDENKNLFNVKHKGSTIIGKNVEIGYGTIIDRAVFDYDYTKIGNFTKIGNNTTIGHNSKIGENNMIMSNIVIGGTCKIGNHNWIGSLSVISNQIKIGKLNTISMGSILFENMKNSENLVKNRIIKKKIFL